MKLEAFKFGLACGLGAAIFWIVCSLLVLAMPAMMLSMSGDMMHMELAEMGWQITLSGIIAGLFGWFVVTSIGGWLVAAIYNRLI